MDTEILDGDNVLRGGRFQTVWGFDESIQRAIVAAAARKGRFIYDRTLGSELYDYIHSGETVNLKQMDDIVKKAVSKIENISVEVKSFVMDGKNARIYLEFSEYGSSIREERMLVL